MNGLGVELLGNGRVKDGQRVPFGAELDELFRAPDVLFCHLECHETLVREGTKENLDTYSDVSPCTAYQARFSGIYFAV